MLFHPVRRLALVHDDWQAGSPLPSGAVRLLAWGTALQELDLCIPDGREGDESLPLKLADAIRHALGCGQQSHASATKGQHALPLRRALGTWGCGAPAYQRTPDRKHDPWLPSPLLYAQGHAAAAGSEHPGCGAHPRPGISLGQPTSD